MSEEIAAELSKDSKPSFDGRIQFYQHLKTYLDAIALYSFEDNPQQFLRAIKGYYSLVRPFIKEEDAKKVKPLLEAAENQAKSLGFSKLNGMQSQSLKNNLWRKLETIREDLYMYSRQMLLPIKQEEEEEFNEANFMEGSDL